MCGLVRKMGGPRPARGHTDIHAPTRPPPPRISICHLYLVSRGRLNFRLLHANKQHGSPCWLLLPHEARGVAHGRGYLLAPEGLRPLPGKTRSVCGPTPQNTLALAQYSVETSDMCSLLIINTVHKHCLFMIVYICLRLAGSQTRCS